MLEIIGGCQKFKRSVGDIALAKLKVALELAGSSARIKKKPRLLIG